MEDDEPEDEPAESQYSDNGDAEDQDDASVEDAQAEGQAQEEDAESENADMNDGEDNQDDFSDEEDEGIPTDADPTHRPDESDPNVIVADNKKQITYLDRLRRRWLNEGGDPGQEIQIPAGYVYYDIVRQNGIHHDMFLYGHPGHHRFRSVNEFYPHLVWLIGGQNGDCPCQYCNRPSRAPGN
jgi:hypothetical protein